MLSRLGLIPEQASTLAARVDALYFFLIAVSGFFAVLIAGLVIYFAIKFRRRSETDLPKPIHGSLALELVWTVIPFALSMVIFLWGASLFIALKRPPDDAIQIFVVGKQWMWKLQHLEGKREINELHVPVGRPVKLLLTSEDVIHSFYVPAFRIKQDAIPGRYTTVWFEATKPGTYHLFCTEYCGTEHSRMIGRIVVLEPASYLAWLAGRGSAAMAVSAAGASMVGTNGGPGGGGSGGGSGSLASAGAELFTRLGCETCHKVESGALGPALAGLFGSEVDIQGGAKVVADETYLRESILHPQAKVVAGYQPVMPTFKGQVSEEELVQLIAYIKSLGGAAVGAAPAAALGRGS